MRKYEVNDHLSHGTYYCKSLTKSKFNAKYINTVKSTT